LSKSKKNFIFSKKSPSQGSLKEILQKSAKLAEKKHYQLFLYIKAQGCQPCALIEKNLDNSLMREIFDSCYIIKIDYFHWMTQLFKNHLRPETAPFFVRINSNGEITNYTFEVGDCKEETPEAIANTLRPYFSDRSEKPLLPVTQKMLSDKITWDIFDGDIAEVKNAIIHKDCDPLYINEKRTYLHTTCSMRSREHDEEVVLELANFFITQGVDLNKQDQAGYTALREAIYQQHYKVAELLIENGADVNLADNDGETPLHRAVINHASDLVKILLKHGADITLKDHHGRTPVDFMDKSDSDMVQYLLED